MERISHLMLSVIFCLLLSQSAVATDWWPMFQHDLNNTGYSNSSLDIDRFVLKWTYTAGDQIYTSSPAILDDRAYVGSIDEKIHAFNFSNGNSLWNTSLGGQTYSSPSVAAGRAYIGNRDNFKMFAFNATNGTQLWNSSTSSWIQSSQAVVGDRVFIGSYDGRTYAFNATNGTQLWNYSTGAISRSSPAVADGVVYIGSGAASNDKVFALNASTGAHIWNYSVAGVNTFIESSPTVSEGVVYIGSSAGPANNNLFYALNATTGAHIWNYTVGVPARASAAIWEDRLYFGAIDGRIYCLNKTDGTQLWNYSTGGHSYSSPAVADGLVFIGSTDCSLYAINATNGSYVWNYSVAGSVDSSPAIVDGKVLVGSTNSGPCGTGRNVYAFGADVLPPNITLVAPLDTQKFSNQEHNFTCNITDDHELVSVNLTIWNETGVYATNSSNLSGTSQVVGFVHNLSEGSYTWNCEAEDGVGNTASSISNFSLIIDLSAPQPQLLTPDDDNISNEDSQNFSCNATDNYGLSSLQLTIWNESGVYATNSSGVSGLSNTSSFIHNLDQEGNYTWNCEGTDEVANSAFAPSNYSLLIDVTSPDASLISPEDSNISNQQLQNFTCNATDNFGLSRIDLTIWNISGVYATNSTSVTGTSNQTTFQHNLALDGNYSWNCEARDNAGNTANATNNNTITIDATNPTANLISPTNGNISNQSLTNFTCNATDNFGLASLNLTLWNESGVYATNSSSVSGLSNSSSFAHNLDQEGNYTWNCEAEDLAGNPDSAINYSLSIDTTAPGVSLVSPEDGNWSYQQLQTLTCNATDNFGLSQISLFVWNASQLYATNSSIVSGPSNQSAFIQHMNANQTYTWNCQAQDLVGQSAWATSNYTLTINETTDQNITLSGGWNLISLFLSV
ncbi:PQQ-binding-like beta-propeller repeat protein [Candidatus Altiarchaeota archaeon]